MRERIVDTLRQPEYTGENRCTPCTVLNAAIAVAIGAVLARRSRAAGVVAVGASAVAIWLRGYLVPGTPELTKRYLPPSVLRLFGKDPEPELHGGLGAVEPRVEDAADPNAEREREDAADSGADRGADGAAAPERGREDGADRPQPSDPETYFLEAGVVEPCAEIDDLCLTASFADDWSAAIDRVDADVLAAADAAAALGFDADDSEFEIGSHGTDARTLRRDGILLGKWPSQAALVADVTAARVLESWDDDWPRYEPRTKGELLNSLRLFLETCPTSGGEVVMGEETVESCCRSRDVIAVTCAETGERLFEYPVSQLDLE